MKRNISAFTEYLRKLVGVSIDIDLCIVSYKGLEELRALGERISDYSFNYLTGEEQKALVRLYRKLESDYSESLLLKYWIEEHDHDELEYFERGKRL